MEFRLPELGEGVNEGELVKWRVKEGEVVRDDQPLCEVMTDKATIEIPSPFSGVIRQLVAKEGEIVKVHQLMVVAEVSGAKAAASPAVSASAPAPAVSAPEHTRSAAVSNTPAAVPAASPASADVLASPATRRAAREKGVDLGRVKGSGPHGRVLMADLEQALGATGASGPKAFSPGAVERTPIRGMRKKISEKMRQSKDKAAHFTYVEEADATELVKLRTRAKVIAEKKGIKLTYLPFILKAMVAALKQHPRINSTVDEAAGEILTHHTYNISLSVQTEDGLTVPVIKHVEQKSLFELAREIAEVVDRARKKRLTMEDFQGSTITLTNAGSIGGLFATPIINHPEVAILGFNKIFRKPVVVQKNGRERLAIRDWTYFSMSLDHRIIDGAEAAEFMKTFIEYIENPALLLLESPT
jgi:pyruvate dehydrogenase E2 component (dihydrolipoamide acetyltransferase)